MGGKARAESFWECFFSSSLPPEGRRWDLVVVGYDGGGVRGGQGMEMEGAFGVAVGGWQRLYCFA